MSLVSPTRSKPAPRWLAPLWLMSLPITLFLIVCIVPLAPTVLIGGYVALTVGLTGLRDAMHSWRTWLPVETSGVGHP